MRYKRRAGRLLPLLLTLLLLLPSPAWGEETAENASRMLVLGPVNPYTDADALNQALEALEAEGYPCLLVVKPVYAHADYPGMRDLVRVLCCAQKNGSPVFLALPVYYGDAGAEELEAANASAMEAWTRMGIYPTGLYLTAEEALDPETAEAARGFATLLVRDAEWDGAASERNAEILRSLLGEGAKNGEGRQVLFGSAYPEDILQSGKLGQFVLIDWTDLNRAEVLSDFLRQRRSAESLMYGHPLRLDSRMIHRVTLGDRVLARGEGGVTLDGVYLPYSIPGEAEEDFDYERGNFFRAVADIAQGSQMLIFLSGAILILFVTFILLARRQMRGRFIRREKR